MKTYIIRYSGDGKNESYWDTFVVAKNLKGAKCRATRMQTALQSSVSIETVDGFVLATKRGSQWSETPFASLLA